MDFEWDPGEPPARFDDPGLPSFIGYGPDLFGELVGYEMLEADVMDPWPLGELGYKNDAPHVHTDGRIESQQHSPDYYAYSPHTESWEEVLQEIESFDWSSDQKNETNASEQQNKSQGGDQVASGADPLRIVDQSHDAELVDGEAAHLSIKIDSPTTQPETSIKNPNKPPLADGIALVLAEPKVSAEHAHSPSPPSQFSPEREKTASCTDTHPQISKDVGSGLPVINEKHVEASDLMDTDDLKIVPETKRLNTDPLMQDDMAAEEGGPVETYDMPVLHDAEGNMVSEMQFLSGSDDDDAVEEPMVTLAPASSRHDSLAMHKSNLEIFSQVDTASQEPPKDESIKPKSLVIADVVQVPPHTTGKDDGGEVIHSSSDALGGLQKQKDGLDNEDQLHDGSAVQIEPVNSTLRLPSEALSEVRDSPTHHRFDQAPDSVSGFATFFQPDSFIIDEGDSLSSKSPEALSRVQEDIERPWQAQLWDAADEQPYDVLSKALPSGHRDYSDQSIRSSSEITAGEVLVRASPLLAAPMPELQLENDLTLPPLPFPSDDNIRHETSQESLAKVSADEENASTAKLAHGLSKPPAPFALELNTTVKDHTTALDVEDSTSVAVIPEEDRMEDVSFAHAQETAKDLGSTTTVPEPKAQPTHPHKRSRASRSTTSVSETDSDGPVKKKPMTNAASLAKACASKAASKKPSKAPKDQEDESTPPLGKSRSAAAKSKKEAAHVDITNEEPSLSTKHGVALKYTGSSAKAPIVVESDDAIISAQSDQGGDSADMREHYSDVEKLATPSKQTPAAEIVLGTPMSRLSVSKRELRDLTPTLYRERPSKAKPISRKLFPPHKANALGELMSSTPAPADSPTVSVSDTDSIGLFGDLGVPDTTTKALKCSAPKPRATPAKAARAKNGPAASGPTKKTPATRTTRKRMAAPKKEEKTKSKEQEEYELLLLFPEPKIDTKGPSPEMDVPLPPRPLRITSRMSLLDDPVIEHAKLGGDKALLSDTTEPEGDDDVPQDIDEDLENEDEDDDDDVDFEDGQDTIEASGDDDDSDNDTPPPSKKPKLKNKPLMLGGHTIRQTRSRATTTPARSIASKAAAPAKNKFGFTPPLTRQAKKTANTSTAPALAKPAPKASAKGKGKKATASVATVSPEPAKQPSVRKTRHASAMVEDKVESKRILRSGG
ncbi:hypothetical protein J4E91_005410 [Alternaria rosae]|nr:hypothetical protein J4E91_005410 [Alternaria rosae]